MVQSGLDRLETVSDCLLSLFIHLVKLAENHLDSRSSPPSLVSLTFWQLFTVRRQPIFQVVVAPCNQHGTYGLTILMQHVSMRDLFIDGLPDFFEKQNLLHQKRVFFRVIVFVVPFLAFYVSFDTILRPDRRVPVGRIERPQLVPAHPRSDLGNFFTILVIQTR